VAFKIIVSPIHGLYDRPNISLALFVSDHLQLAGLATVRVAWLLALGRMTVVAFFAVFLVFCHPRLGSQTASAAVKRSASRWRSAASSALRVCCWRRRPVRPRPFGCTRRNCS